MEDECFNTPRFAVVPLEQIAGRMKRISMEKYEVE